jgi:hypothetical protein
VLRPFLPLSFAVDRGVETVVHQFYETEIPSLFFPPLYAKCLKAYIQEILLRAQPPPEPEDY